MADQMINQLPVKTAPQTGDKLLVIGAAEEQLIDYDKLADAILTKLASKTFALDQGTKSLVAALNELNSKTSGLRCEYVMLGNNGTGISIKMPKVDWGKRSAFLFGCDNTTGVVHEVIAAHYDPSRKQVIARTSGKKEWAVNQEEMTINTTFISNSEFLIIHTGFEAIKVV